MNATRPRRHGADVLEKAVQIAIESGKLHAARVTGVSPPTIAKEMKARGLHIHGKQPRRYPAALIEQAVSLACATSQANAFRATGIHMRTIRIEMRKRGLETRRPGNFTLAEIDRMKGLLLL